MNSTRKTHTMLRWLIPFIPSVYHRSPYMYGKVQTYIISVLGINAFGVIFLFVCKYYLQPTEYSKLDMITAVVGLLVNILAILILRFTKKLWLSYTIFSVSGLLVLDVVTFTSGGLYSTTLLWTIFIPIGASLLLNIRSGIVWGIIIVVNTFAFFILHEYFFPELIEMMEPPLIRVIDFAFVFAGIITIIFLFEKGRYYLYNRLLNSNKEIRRQNEELNQLNQEKEQLMSVVAHDLKSPLNTVSTIMNILELSDNLTEEQIDCINSTRDLISSANKLIRDLLYSHEIKEVNFSQKLSNINIASLVEKTVASFQTVAEAKRIKIEVSYTNPSHEINTYSDFIQRILDNIISNAIKFSSFDKKIHISCGIENKKAFFIIQDEGPGISPEDQQKLFMRFQKLSARPTGGESSNGLGLAIVKSLVDILKGEISVNSSVGYGTEFSVQIPTFVEQKVPF